MDDAPREQLTLAIETPAGPVTALVALPDGLIPVSRIVPLLRHVGEQAQALEQQRTPAAVSCAKGCAACCRMLIPVSPPEAFALAAMVAAWPEDRRQHITRRLAAAQARLEEAGLRAPLQQLTETTHQVPDEAVEPLNGAYYALQLPCVFLDNEVCSIYEDRPAACRELLVTSPAHWCQDLGHKPVQALPVPLRMGTILSLLWSALMGGPPRLIPLPLALAWADRHAAANRPVWSAKVLLETALEQIWEFLRRPAR